MENIVKGDGSEYLDFEEISSKLTSILPIKKLGQLVLKLFSNVERVEPWGERVGVTYATCMTVSDLMWRLLLNAHSFIQNNKLCTLRKTYVDLKSQI
jgi:hypothetical protein